jgi:hypothetical protein
MASPRPFFSLFALASLYTGTATPFTSCSLSNTRPSSTPALRLHLRPQYPDVNIRGDLPLLPSQFLPLHDPTHPQPSLTPLLPPPRSPPYHPRRLQFIIATSRTTALTHLPHLVPRLYLTFTNTPRRTFCGSLPPFSSRSSTQTMSYQSHQPLPCHLKRPALHCNATPKPPSGHPSPSPLA